MLSQPGFCDACSLRHAATCDLNHLHATKKPLHFLQTCDNAHCWSHHTKLQTASVLVYDCCNLSNSFLNCGLALCQDSCTVCSNACSIAALLQHFKASLSLLTQAMLYWKSCAHDSAAARSLSKEISSLQRSSSDA